MGEQLNRESNSWLGFDENKTHDQEYENIEIFINGIWKKMTIISTHLSNLDNELHQIT